MVDIVDTVTRSRMMAGIRGKNTKPEILLRKAMHAKGYRFRLHDRRLPGQPDMILPRYRTAVFIHGCFWHRHKGCRYATSPATRQDFWAAKFEANVARDHAKEKAVLEQGWRIAVVWECALRNSVDEAASRLSDWLQSEESARIEIPAPQM